MKIYTIGRDASSKITFTDDMISRQHAILRVHDTGKMEIIDKSANGTFINNVRIASNVPVPVKRSDIVSFAKTRQLDWTMVDNPLSKYWKILIAALAVLAIIIALILIPKACDSSESIVDEEGTPTKTDAAKAATSDKDKAKVDSSSQQSAKDTTKNKSAKWVNEEIRRRTAKPSHKADSKPQPKENKKQEPKVKDTKTTETVPETKGNKNVIM